MLPLIDYLGEAARVFPPSIPFFHYALKITGLRRRYRDQTFPLVDILTRLGV